MKNFRKNQGITLIALVITVIVLLILAGITIATLIGDNGILTRAQEAKNKTEQAEKDEKEKLGDMEDTINEYATGITVKQVTDENPGVLEGTGTDDDPYTINSIEDLVVFASNVTNGTTYEGQTVKLGLSLDFNSNKSYVDPLRTDYGHYGYDGELKTLLMSGEGFKPIGTTYDTNVSTNYFKGTFDGDYNTVYNMYQSVENSEYITIAGFFSTNGGTIRNLKLERVDVKAITNNLNLLYGGIAGRNSGILENSSLNGNINFESNGNENSFVGGLIGQNLGDISECYNKGIIYVFSNNITIPQDIYIAGIAGGNYGTINACYNTGNLTVNMDNLSVLRLSGIADGSTISNCYNVGNIYKKNIDETFFTEEQKLSISGIGGKNGEYNYNIGEIIIESSIAGYACGISSFSNIEVIDNCYNIGIINSTNINISIGSLTGWMTNNKITNSKWLKGTAEQAIATKGSNVEDGTTMIETIEEMPDILSVIGNQFKKDTNNINNGYPILTWQ